jgi:hypothetical protein
MHIDCWLTHYNIITISVDTTIKWNRIGELARVLYYFTVCEKEQQINTRKLNSFYSTIRYGQTSIGNSRQLGKINLILHDKTNYKISRTI